MRSLTYFTTIFINEILGQLVHLAASASAREDIALIFRRDDYSYIDAIYFHNAMTNTY